MATALPPSRSVSQSLKGLLDCAVALLCCWAAAYHTPIGALLRNALWFVSGVTSRAQPLLSYYSSGLYDAHALAHPGLWVAPRPWTVGAKAELTSAEALGAGVAAAWAPLLPSEREPGSALARHYGVDPAALKDPTVAASLVQKVSPVLGSDEAAVLALFCGEEEARYVAQRARAEGDPLTLEAMVRQLPPDTIDNVGSATQAMTYGRAYSLAWPVPASVPVTSPFGLRQHPVLGGVRLHTGVDLGMPEGSMVRAVAAGQVRRASEDAVNGRMVMIDHGRGVTTAYCHNSELLVVPGQRVEEGTLLARSGNTGRSTGPHLHYQLELGNVPMDPLLFRRAAHLEATAPPARKDLKAKGKPSPAPSSAVLLAPDPGPTEY